MQSEENDYSRRSTIYDNNHLREIEHDHKLLWLQIFRAPGEELIEDTHLPYTQVPSLAESEHLANRFKHLGLCERIGKRRL